MVDFGPTALRQLKQLGFDHRELDCICFTHLHGDHIGGFPFWLLDSTYNEIRDRDIDIIGPFGVEERLMNLLRQCFGDVADKPRPFNLNFFELLPGDILEFRDWKVRGFAADHMDPPEKPLCLQIESPRQKKLAFSGDTQFCDGLFEAARDVEMLIAECSAMRPPAGRHCTWEEWEQQFSRLQTARLCLTHLNEEVREKSPELKGPEGVELSFADDGMVFEF